MVPNGTAPFSSSVNRVDINNNGDGNYGDDVWRPSLNSDGEQRDNCT